MALMLQRSSTLQLGFSSISNEEVNLKGSFSNHLNHHSL